MDEIVPRMGVVKRPTSSLIPGVKASTDTKGQGFPISFRHLGRKGGYEITLYANTAGSRKKWLELIDAQQDKLRARGDFYNKNIITANFFTAANRVNCCAPFDGGRKLIYGTDTGIYVSDRRSKEAGAKPRRVLDVQNVTQIDVLEEYQLLLVLSAKSLLSYPLSALDPNEPALSKRSKKIQSHCNFFKTGICLGRHLVCCVKSSALSTTIKVFEPNDAMSKGKKQKGFKMFNSGGQDELKAFKEFYIPTESSSIHFLKSKLCVACARGFEVVSLETLETQSLLDQADTSLDFVSRREGVRPIHIERLNGEFLLNYSEFSFFVNRNGWRARPDWKIDWEGLPQNFALSYPWILAFEPNFIEIRNIETQTVHIIPSKNIRMLHTSTREVCYLPALLGSHSSPSSSSRSSTISGGTRTASRNSNSSSRAGSSKKDDSTRDEVGSKVSRSASRASIASMASMASIASMAIVRKTPRVIRSTSRTSIASRVSPGRSPKEEFVDLLFVPMLDIINRTYQILYAYEDEQGQDVVASIDFWLGRRPDAHMSIMPPAHSPEPAPQLPPLQIGGRPNSSQAR